MEAKAQDPEIIKDWASLEEAEFMFDVYYRIIKCEPNSSPEIHLIAFNEGGKVESIGFTLELEDENGNSFTHEIDSFAIGKYKTLRTSCDNDENAFLKFVLPDNYDIPSLTIDITYNR